MQVGTGESKLLLFETFWFYYFFFFTRAIPRGARAPKKILARVNGSQMCTVSFFNDIGAAEMFLTFLTWIYTYQWHSAAL